MECYRWWCQNLRNPRRGREILITDPRILSRFHADVSSYACIFTSTCRRRLVSASSRNKSPFLPFAMGGASNSLLCARPARMIPDSHENTIEPAYTRDCDTYLGAMAAAVNRSVIYGSSSHDADMASYSIHGNGANMVDLFKYISNRTRERVSFTLFFSSRIFFCGWSNFPAPGVYLRAIIGTDNLHL